LVVLVFKAHGQDRVTLPEKLTGPMVGYVTPTEATIWAYAGPGAKLELRYRQQSGPSSPQQSVPMTPKPEDHDVAKATLKGLKPATAYRYELSLDGKTDPAWQGRFATRRLMASRARFKMAVSSCMEVGATPTQPSWYLMLAQRPALNCCWATTFTPTRPIAKPCGRSTGNSGGRRVAAKCNVPTYAMWDDHDYGPNNSDGTAPGKENSLRAFASCSPTRPPASMARRAFYRFAWGDVDFFMLDGRYHRSPDKDPNDDNKRMLGDGQFMAGRGLKTSRLSSRCWLRAARSIRVAMTAGRSTT
jgi:alkaline phosphatase D